MSDHPSVAVIADAHFHDLNSDYGFAGITIGERRMAVRSWDETRQSTRVFNESARALSSALDAVILRGIRHVVLLGDYSDDGQHASVGRLRAILEDCEREHGIRFYALPGNHDIFGPEGRHQTKQFISQDGAPLTVSSDVLLTDQGAIASADMYCEGYPVGLQPMARFGYYRRAEDLHWETPFGTCDRDADRTYEVRSANGLNRFRLMDASYLVEPAPGLWLLMIDANIFEPRDGSFMGGEEAAFIDSTAAGWNALLRCKPFLIDWMADVAKRARAGGKTLLAFSHYPALDPFDGVTGAESVLFGQTNVVRRTPRAAVAEAMAGAGISVHFSGHLHVEGLTRTAVGGNELVNIAVPSLVAFPPAFKVLDFQGETVAVDTVCLNDITLDPDVSEVYDREAAFAGNSDEWQAQTYGEFLLRHKRALIRHRYFEKEWPRAVTERFADLTLADVCALLGGTDGVGGADLEKRAGLGAGAIAAIGFVDMVVDWYCLRQASHLAFDVISPERCRLYRTLAEEFGAPPSGSVDGDTLLFLRVFLGAFIPFLDRAERGGRRLTLRCASNVDAMA